MNNYYCCSVPNLLYLSYSVVEMTTCGQVQRNCVGMTKYRVSLWGCSILALEDLATHMLRLDHSLKGHVETMLSPPNPRLSQPSIVAKEHKCDE